MVRSKNDLEAGEKQMMEMTYRYVSWLSWPMLSLSVPWMLALNSLLQTKQNKAEELRMWGFIQKAGSVIDRSIQVEVARRRRGTTGRGLVLTAIGPCRCCSRPRPSHRRRGRYSMTSSAGSSSICSWGSWARKLRTRDSFLSEKERRRIFVSSWFVTRASLFLTSFVTITK